MTEELKIPKRIFIVPYRNRVQHKFFFSKYMSFILEDKDDYEIYFSHQCDARTFNRGATRNIGFIAARNKYPEHYKDITFIFNDVDTIPFNKIFDYETTHGIVKHYYGYEYALGGIVVMKGADFEKINGYPCFWGWGTEDTVLQSRCDRVGLYIDRQVFYKIGSPEILQLFDGISRIISKKDPWRGKYDDGNDGLSTISKLNYTIDDKSENPNDNIFAVHNPKIFIINIKTFLTYIPFGSEEYYNYDLREPQRKIINPNKIKETVKSVVNTTDWSNIPYYPTTREKRINVANYLIKMGKQVPDSLMKQIEEDKQKDIDEDSYNVNITKKVTFHENTKQNPGYSQNYSFKNNVNPQFQNAPNSPNYPNHNLFLNQQHQQQYRQPPHIFSPQYANYIGKKMSQPSAKIHLGGAF